MGIARSSKAYFCALVCLCGVGLATAGADELALMGGAERIQWEESTSAGRLLEESGTLFRGGGFWRRPFSEDRMLLEIRGSGYFGRLKYDGQACNVASSVCTPYQSHANYLGLAGEATVAREYGGTPGGEIFAGGGFDTWRRDIKGDSNTSGVVEDWFLLYAIAGGGYRWSHPGARYELRAGLKYPLYASDTNHFYDVTVEPKGRVSGFARLVVDFPDAARPRWGLGAYYDSYRFDRSDVVRVDPARTGCSNCGVFQPRTEQDTIGLYGIIYLR